MKLILIDGGPASGKNTIGTLLENEFHKIGEKVMLLDLDAYVEEFNPHWTWENKQQEEKDQLNARINFLKDINKYLKDNFTIIAIGERFLTKNNIIHFIKRLEITCPVYLYHLCIPLDIRKQRLQNRGSHSLIDLEKDQRERDVVKNWYGYVYNNINSAKEDAESIMKLIQEKKGLLNLEGIK